MADRSKKVAKGARQRILEDQLRRKIDDLEEQNRRLQEANQESSKLLGGMSHELRTPLISIVGLVELMVDGMAGELSATQKEYLGDILTSSRQLLQLVNDLEELARVESGRLEFCPEPVDLERLVGEVRENLSTLAAKKRIRIDTRIEPRLKGVVADPAKLKQFLSNCLSNALKSTPNEGTVMLRLSPEGESFRIELEGSGVGMQTEEHERLFVDFFEIDAERTKKHHGMGPGLVLARRIVEAQGGTFGVRKTPGQGRVFFAVLPQVARLLPDTGAVREVKP